MAGSSEDGECFGLVELVSHTQQQQQANEAAQAVRSGRRSQQQDRGGNSESVGPTRRSSRRENSSGAAEASRARRSTATEGPRNRLSSQHQDIDETGQDFNSAAPYSRVETSGGVRNSRTSTSEVTNHRYSYHHGILETAAVPTRQASTAGRSSHRLSSQQQRFSQQQDRVEPAEAAHNRVPTQEEIHAALEAFGNQSCTRQQAMIAAAYVGVNDDITMVEEAIASEPSPKLSAEVPVPDCEGADKVFKYVLDHRHHHAMKTWKTHEKWGFAIFYCLLQAFVTLTTTSYLSCMEDIQAKFGGTKQVVTVGQSLFVVGNAVGPAIMGPLSDCVGRKWVYVWSIAFYSVFNLAAAYSINLPMQIVFMFFCGVSGSASLTNVAGSIADVFGDVAGASQPMALFVISANVGPSFGAPLGRWLADDPKLGFQWVFKLNAIIAGVFTLLLLIPPETLPRILMAEGAREDAIRDNETEPSEIGFKMNLALFNEVKFMTTQTFMMLITEPIIIFLGLFNGFTYGLLFLYLNSLKPVFVDNNHLSPIVADLTYLNFVVGVVAMFLYVPIQTRLYARDRRITKIRRPEARFISCLVFVWLFPISFLWFAFTCDGNVSYWSPIIAGTVLAFVDPLVWLGMLNYITDTYPHAAASAIAAFFVPSFLIAAGFSHIGALLFVRLGVKWGMATIGFVSFSVVVLVYVIYFFGYSFRRRSIIANEFAIERDAIMGVKVVRAAMRGKNTPSDFTN